MKKAVTILLCTSLLSLAVVGCTPKSTETTQTNAKEESTAISKKEDVNVIVKNRSHGDKMLSSLEKLEQDGITVIFSDGYKEKALANHNRLLGMQGFYGKRYDTKVKLELAILDKNNWENGDEGVDRDGLPPYGIPHVDHNKDDYTIYIPASEDGFLVKYSMQYKDILTEDIKAAFKDAGYTYENGVKLFPDLIGLHEVGHTFVDKLGLKDLQPWFNEYLATYFAYSYLVETDESLAKLWAINGEVAYLDGSKPNYNTLTDFNKLISEVGASEYDWYQKEFAKQAKLVYDQKGISFIDDVIELYNSEEFEQSLFSSPSYDESKLVEQLEEIVPVFKTWIKDVESKGKK